MLGWWQSTTICSVRRSSQRINNYLRLLTARSLKSGVRGSLARRAPGIIEAEAKTSGCKKENRKHMVVKKLRFVTHSVGSGGVCVSWCVSVRVLARPRMCVYGERREACARAHGCWSCVYLYKCVLLYGRTFERVSLCRCAVVSLYDCVTVSLCSTFPSGVMVSDNKRMPTALCTRISRAALSTS